MFGHLFGLWFFDWQPFSVIYIFWAETAVVAFLNIFKTPIASLFKEDGRFFFWGIFPGIIITAASTAFIGFFMFCHYMFIGMMGAGILSGKPLAGRDISSGDELAATAFGINSIEPFYETGWFAVLLILLSHIISFFMHFIGEKEYIKARVIETALKPMARIFILQIAIILAGASIVLSGGRAMLLFAAFVIVKIIIDLHSHLKEHNIKVPEWHDFKNFISTIVSNRGA